jgi:hypothetical protein
MSWVGIDIFDAPLAATYLAPDPRSRGPVPERGSAKRGEGAEFPAAMEAGFGPATNEPAARRSRRSIDRRVARRQMGAGSLHFACRLQGLTPSPVSAESRLRQGHIVAIVMEQLGVARGTHVGTWS